jgi:ribosomal protein L21E
MSNKRQSHDQQFFWAQAEAQLKSYLEKEYEIGTAGDKSVQHGAVAIGTKVRFYRFHHGRRGKVECFGGDEYNVEHGRDELQKALMKMKTQIEGW